MARQLVVDRDRGWAKFKRHMRSAKGAHVKIGVTAEVGAKPKEERGPGDVRQKSERTVVEIAFWNEFGTKNIPARSFIRSTHDENRRRIRSLKRRLGRMMAHRKIDIRGALGVLGEFMKAKQIQKIDRLRTPPNAPSTRRRKRSSNPLVDLGQLKQSIQYQVVLPAGRRVMP